MVSPYRQHWTLDPDWVFLNHGSYGACPAAVQQHQQRLRAELEAQPVLFMGRRTPRIDANREVVADFLHASTEEIALVPNATHGVNAVLRSLRFDPGDELLVTDHEYNACRNALDYVAERAGATVVVVDLPLPLTSPEQVVQVMLDAVTERTRLCLIDQFTSPTALRLPIESLIPALQKRGVEVLVDGAHAPGQEPLDLTALGADYWTGNLHKWVCAPKGCAVLYVKRAHHDKIRPTVISHGANADFAQRSRFHQEFDWTGTFDPTAWLTTGFTLDYVGGLMEGGWPEVMERNRALALRVRRMLLERWGTAPICPEEMLGTMASVCLPEGVVEAADQHSGSLHAYLTKEHSIEIPIIPWGAGLGTMLRYSVHLYNEFGDYEVLADAIAELQS